MRDIVVRPYEDRDQEQTWHVRAMTYNSGRPIPVEQQVYKTAKPFVGEVDGQVVGTFVIMDMTCTRGPKTAFKTGGIAGVAVLPEARQTGIGSAMMRWSLRHMREQGYVLAALYAFRESFYRKFGYATCGMRYKITCPMSRFPRPRSVLPLWRVSPGAFDVLKPCYESFARARSGMNLREDFHWGRILGESQTIYAAGDPPEGYAILEHDVAFWERQWVKELAWSSERGYDSILSLLGSVGINKTELAWYEPSDSPFLARYLDHGVGVEQDRPIMYRLLNVPAALQSLRSEHCGAFTVAVRDPDLPENNGPWHVAFTPESTAVEVGRGADLELDAHEAVQAVLGQPSLSDLVRNGVTASCGCRATDLMTPAPVYCMEFF